MTLVPSFFTLLGEKTWYMPRWLDRVLPGITIEPPHDGKGRAPVATSDPRRPVRARSPGAELGYRGSAPP